MSESEAVAGVALAVELRAASEPAFVPEPPRRRIGDVLPVRFRSDVELCGELQRVQAVESMLAAYKTELVLALAAQRPAELDLAEGEPGAATWGPGEVRLPEVSEFFPDELGQVLRCSRAAATELAETSIVLLTRLTATWGRLADGLLDWPRARAIAAELGWPARDVPDSVVHAVEGEVLPRAAGLGIRALRELIRARLLAHGVDLSERRRRDAEQLANVRIVPERDGMSELRAFLPTASATACADAVDRYARMLEADGDTRPLGSLRAVVLADLVLRPWDTSRPPVTAQLTITAPIATLRTQHPAGHDGAAASGTGSGPQPIADLDGKPITAACLRSILEQLDAVCPGGLQAPAGGSLAISLVDPVSGRLRAVLTRAQLQALARAGCPDHPAGDDEAADCGCPILDRPDPTDRYRPTAAQYRFVRTRDRGCRFPGCANKAGWSDADHVIPHACGGQTACENLCCLCRRHHRLKTHAHGWLFVMTDDGTLTVTTPAGVTRTTRPPGLTPPPTRVLPEADDPPPF
jgi:hypothetical protein